ncbi:MAG: GDP-mannose-dependent alpha-(1-6)-phosphatidylinositol monomannoside mannosyltransferase [Candidatus Hinthialibacteria bacterium OLB16]|nr:MAG: GDP-mannose-dependent alpha-(1-6)-phosphatidylinositol monomannoside mannosyltransferase [Candidatus Hinthialibacteria bacterium OLB16]
MKIGMVCYPSIGGSGIVASELGKGLMDRGHEIHFFSYDLPHRLAGDERRYHFHHVDVPLYPVFRFPPYTLALATRLTEVAQEHDLDLIHVHYAIPHSTSGLLAKMMACHYNHKDLKIITTLHGTDIDLVGWEPSYRTIVEYSINSSDAVTAVSNNLKSATLEKFKVNRDIHVIYNPIDTTVFHPAPNSPVNNHSPKTILHVSNFRPVKRVQDAVKVLDLARNHLPVRLVFLGDGPDRDLAEKTARQLGVLDRVVFRRICPEYRGTAEAGGSAAFHLQQ